jgi:hypothetical protein
MKSKIKAIGIASLLLSLSALALAAVDGLSVRRQPKVDQIIKLRLKANLEIGGVQATYTGLVVEKTTKVDTDGSFTYEETQSEGSAKFGDQTVPVPDIGPFPVTLNADGSLKEIKGDASTAGPEAYRMTNLEVLIDSGKPLAVGDTWSVDIKAGDKAKAAKAEYKVIAEEKAGDIDTIKVKFTVKETEGTEPASSDGTYWISKADGSLVRSEVKWANAPFPGAPTPISATMTETREN